MVCRRRRQKGQEAPADSRFLAAVQSPLASYTRGSEPASVSERKAIMVLSARSPWHVCATLDQVRACSALRPVPVPGVACHCCSQLLNDHANERNWGAMSSTNGQAPYVHARPIPCATGSNARHALYLCLANPSLRVSRSRSASFWEAWVEITLHPLKATSTTIHLSIGACLFVIVHPSHSWRSRCT